MRQRDAAHRSFGKALAVDEDAFRGPAVFVGDKADQITVVLIDRPHPWRKGCLAAVAAILKHHVPAFPSVQVVLHEAVEQEPAGL